jgi:hypothetical protein
MSSAASTARSSYPGVGVYKALVASTGERPGQGAKYQVLSRARATLEPVSSPSGRRDQDAAVGEMLPVDHGQRAEAHGLWGVVMPYPQRVRHCQRPLRWDFGRWEGLWFEVVLRLFPGVAAERGEGGGGLGGRGT